MKVFLVAAILALAIGFSLAVDWLLWKGYNWVAPPNWWHPDYWHFVVALLIFWVIGGAFRGYSKVGD